MVRMVRMVRMVTLQLRRRDLTLLGSGPLRPGGREAGGHPRFQLLMVFDSFLVQTLEAGKTGKPGKSTVLISNVASRSRRANARRLALDGLLAVFCFCWNALLPA